MRRIRTVWLVWALLSAGGFAAGEQLYELVFSTYVGGKKWEHARDVCSDREGNVYMVGGTASPDFPTTPGAYDHTFHDGGKRLCDAFVMKFSPEGRLIWSTLLEKCTQSPSKSYYGNCGNKYISSLIINPDNANRLICPASLLNLFSGHVINLRKIFTANYFQFQNT